MPKIAQKAIDMPASPIRKLVPFADAAKKKGKIVFHLNIGQPDIETPEVALNAIRNFDQKVIINCIKSSLSTNFFLHFAGTWFESELWKTGNFYSLSNIKELNLFLRYLKTPVYGRPKGLIRPEIIKK